MISIRTTRYAVSLVAMLCALASSCTVDEEFSADRLWTGDEDPIVDLHSGVYFGMPQQDFVKLCRDGNAEGVMSSGEENFVEVEVAAIGGIPSPVFGFYPAWKKDSVAELRARAHSSGWNPWNAALSPDSCVADVLVYLDGLFPGGKFETVDGVRTTYRKSVANLLITVQPTLQRYVRIVLTDRSKVLLKGSEAERLRLGTDALHPLEYSRLPE